MPHELARAAGYAVRGAAIDQVQPFAFDRGPIGCVLLHGFTAAPKEMRPLGDYLAARDYHRARRALCRTWHLTARSGAHHLARLGRFGGRSRDGTARALLASVGDWPVAGRLDQPASGRAATGRWRVRHCAGHLSRPIGAWRIARLLTPFMPYSRKDLADLQDPIALAEHADYDLFPTRAVAELNALMRHTRRRLAPDRCAAAVDLCAARSRRLARHAGLPSGRASPRPTNSSSFWNAAATSSPKTTTKKSPLRRLINSCSSTRKA